MIIREFRDDSRKGCLSINKNGKLIMPYNYEIIGVCVSGLYDQIVFKTRPIKEDRTK